MDSDALRLFCIDAAHALHAYGILALVFYLGQSGAIELGLGRTRAVRWLAGLVVGASVLSATFQLTAALHLFLFPYPTSLLAGLAMITAAARLHAGRTSLLEHLRGDLRCSTRLLRTAMTGRLAIVYAFLLLAALLVASRVLQTPPLAWDALTYHAVKPALWLQSGGDLILDAPGGWSTHKGRLAGTELYGAWAFLAGHGDPLWGAVDLFWWGGLALGLHVLSAGLGLRARDRAAVIAYGCSVPALLLSVGSGYAELPLSTFFVAALALLSVAKPASDGREHHTGAIACAGIALALLASMKLIAWLSVLCLLGVCCWGLAQRLRMNPGDRPALLAIGVIGLAFGTIALPSPLGQFIETGYPLSVPLVIGPWSLGPPNAELEFLETLSANQPSGFAAELQALAWIFGHPLRIAPQLSALALGALAFVTVGAVSGLRGIGSGSRQRRRTVLILSLSSLALLATYFAPSFETVRLHWAQTNARHLLPAVLPLLPLAFIGTRGQTWRAWAARALFLAAACWHAVGLAAFGWAPDFGARAFGGLIVLVGFLALVVVGPRVFFSRESARKDKLRLGFAMLVPFGIALFSFSTGNAERRSIAFQQSSVFEETPKYWAPAALRLDDPERPARIAVTAGPEPAADGWFLYPFFGSELTNHLTYVPVTDSDAILALAPGSGRNQQARAGVWLKRLQEAEIDYVMAFWPTRLEIGWMQARPDQFERLEGDGESWGLYRFSFGSSRPNEGFEGATK